MQAEAFQAQLLRKAFVEGEVPVGGVSHYRQAAARALDAQLMRPPRRRFEGKERKKHSVFRLPGREGADGNLRRIAAADNRPRAVFAAHGLQPVTPHLRKARPLAEDEGEVALPHRVRRKESAHRLRKGLVPRKQKHARGRGVQPVER
jgi:hypothetical protein